MNIGATLDRIIMLVTGIALLYFSIAKKEKIGSKAALLRLIGIVVTGFAVIDFIIALSRGKY